MNEEQIKTALNTIRALVENQPGDDMTKIGATAALVLLECFLLNQSRQTIALESLAKSLASLDQHR